MTYLTVSNLKMAKSTIQLSQICSRYFLKSNSVQKTVHYPKTGSRLFFMKYSACKPRQFSTQFTRDGFCKHMSKLSKRDGCTTAAIASGNLSGAITKQQAKDLAIKLTSEERDILINALQECQSQKIKAEFESQLAAFRWRSKFGRPSKVPTLGEVDPTGSYCKVPDDWLLRKYAEAVPRPTRAQLIKVMAANAIPFVGFGFLDNFVMILAGDQIETTVGSMITLSTMAAAAVGNTISDIMGIGSAYYVEQMAQKIGFESPKLTPMQMDLPVTRRAANVGRVLGVTIGCWIGMVPLLFLH